MDTTKLTPQLNDQQLRQNIDALLKGGQNKQQVQEYVNNYSKGADGSYVLKNQGGAVATPEEPGYFERVFKSGMELPGKISEAGNEGANLIAKGGQDKNPIEILRGFARGVLGPAAAGVNTLFAPMTEAVRNVPGGNTVKGGILGTALGGPAGGVAGAGIGLGLDAVNGLKSLILSNPKAAEYAKQNPDLEKTLNDVLTLGITYLGTKNQGAKDLLNTPVSEVPGEVMGNFKGAGSSISSTIKNIPNQVSEGLGGLKNLTAPKNQEQVMSTPEAELYKLSPTERELYFKTKQDEISQQSSSLEEKVKTDLTQTTEQIQTEAEGLQRELSVASRDKVLELRPKIQQALGRQSQEYRRLVDEELAPVRDNQVKAGDLKSFINKRFAENPEQAKIISEQIGLDKMKSAQTMKLGEIYDKTKELGQDISTAAKKGTRTYTSDEKLVDDTISTLVDYMKSQGVDLKNARQFWAKYAPIRNQLVSEAKPFNQSGTQTQQFANRLIKVASEKDVNSENYIKEVEGLVGQPITKEVRDVLSKMDANEKHMIAAKAGAEAQKAEIKLQEEKASGKLNDQEFKVKQAANQRAALKKAIIYTAGFLGLGELSRHLPL